jgi:hypothetical protein
MTPAIETNRLTKRFRRVAALSDCSIVVPEGRISALVERPQVDRPEPGHHRGEVTLALGQVGRGAADPPPD